MDGDDNDNGEPRPAWTPPTYPAHSYTLNPTEAPHYDTDARFFPIATARIEQRRRSHWSQRPTRRPEHDPPPKSIPTGPSGRHSPRSISNQNTTHLGQTTPPTGPCSAHLLDSICPECASALARAPSSPSNHVSPDTPLALQFTSTDPPPRPPRARRLWPGTLPRRSRRRWRRVASP